MSSLRTTEVFPGSAPLYWTLDKKRPKDEKAIPGNILKCYERKCKEEGSPPNWFMQRSIIDCVAGVAGLLGLLGFIGSKTSSSASKLWKWLSGIVTVGGLGVLGVGLFRSVGASVKESFENKIKSTKAFAEKKEISSPRPLSIDRTISAEVKEEGVIPATMWDPGVHGKGKIEYLIDHTVYHSDLSTKQDYESAMKEALNDPRGKSKKIECNKDQITACELPHYVYKARAGDTVIDIVVPKAYADNRKGSLERAFLAIEESLSAIPSNLPGLIKRIKFSMCKPPGNPEMLTDDESEQITVFHKGFDMANPSKARTKSEIESEDKMIQQLSLDKRKKIMIIKKGKDGKKTIIGNSSSCGLHHEIGHLISFHIQKKYPWAQVPKEIFPEDSSIRGEELSIDDSFAKGRDTDSWKDKNDAWAQIALADRLPVSAYGTLAGTVEDIPETTALFLWIKKAKSLEMAKKIFSHRFSFIEHAIAHV